MTEGKLLIYHPNGVVADKLGVGLKGIGYNIETAVDIKSLKKTVSEHQPHVPLGGAHLDDKAKNIITSLNEQAENDLSVIAISEDPSLKLNDRIEAYNCGVNDFISLRDNMVELKSKILFQKGALEEKDRDFKAKRRLEKLTETNYNLILSQGLENLFEVAIEHLEVSYPVCFLVFSIFNRTNSDFDFIKIISAKDADKIKTDQISNNALWRDYLLASSNRNSGVIKKPELLEHLQKLGIESQKLYDFPMVYKGALLGRLVLACGKDQEMYEDEIDSLQAFTQVLAHRVREVRRFYGLEKQSAKSPQSAINYFQRPSEDQIIQSLCVELNKSLQADMCLYMNYNEGFRFLSPKYLFKGEDEENVLDTDKPPVLMLNDYPAFEKLLTLQKHKLVDLTKDEDQAQYKHLPGINSLPISNLAVYHLAVSGKIRGFLLLGRETIVKKYTTSELQTSDGLMKSASKALEESEILKQAKLTVKQLERIFDLGTELTLDASVDKILIKICTAIRRTLGWNVVILDKKNDFDDNFYTVSVMGIKDTDFQALIKNKEYPPFKERLENSIPISHSYFYDHTRTTGSDNEPLIGEWNDNDWVYVPISSRGKLLGMITLNDPVERRKPAEDRIRSLEFFANQSAVVIENTELFERLKSSELRYRLLAETMTMGLVTCNTTGKILYVNNSLVKILNYDIKDELLDKSIYNLCSENSKHKLEKEVLRTMSDKGEIDGKNEEIIGLEIELVDKDKEPLPFMIYTSPFYQHNKRIGFFAVLSDLRNQKKIERMRADFNSMIVHDLRSPLNIIQGYVDIVRTGVVGDINDEQIELLTIAKENVFKLLKLIDSFLTASKLEAGHLTIEPEINSINSLIETLNQHYQVLAKEKKINLTMDLDSHIPLQPFDKFRMEQVLRNYLSNAIKFTPPEGTITISSKLLKKKIDKNGDFDLFVQVSVTDTGVGISKEEMGKVFNKYEQTEAGKDASLKGTGLGLAICREIIELHKGEVWVKSNLHEGSTFGFTIPIENIDI